MVVNWWIVAFLPRVEFPCFASKSAQSDPELDVIPLIDEIV